MKVLLNTIFIILFAAMPYCRSGSHRKDVKFNQNTIDANSIVFYIPRTWQETKDHYFHFKAVGFAPNGLPASIEYRGLDFKTLDENGKNLYATGWFEAIAKNYPEWKYEYKKKVEGDSEGGYEFEGTYRVATDTFRRIGKLRFRNKQIHAIYYTALDKDFDLVRVLFKQMDDKILYEIQE